jgi:transcriptional regulator with PAS, ATPase and Fis domain
MNSLFQLNDVHFVVGLSPVMQKVHQLILKAARTDFPVMITGETGVGKEVAARFIHYHSHRKNNPFVKVNCAVLSPQLIESEFFGHEKGAFTGADVTRLGRLEISNQGTLLLDEINEIDVRLQAKLLQVIEDNRFERVGSSFPQKIDIRFIATSNQNIKDIIKDGKFRADLYYRLNVISIYIPPLRERREDIVPLIQDFFEMSYEHSNNSPKRLHEKAIKLLLDYNWPGNIRELFNFLRRITTFVTENDYVMPEQIMELFEKTPESTQSSKESFSGLPLSDMEKEAIQSTLFYCKGNQQKAAQHLGISDRTLRNKIKQYAINNERVNMKGYL